MAAEARLLDKDALHRVLPTGFDVRRGSIDIAAPVVHKDEGMGIAEAFISERIERKRPVTLLVGGGPGSGRNTISKEMAERFDDKAVVLSMGNYSRGRMFVDRNTSNFYNTDSVDYPLLLEHLWMLSRGKEIEMPLFDTRTGERKEALNENTKETEEQRVTVKPKEVIILEGLHALGAEIAPTGHLNLFMNRDLRGGLLRRAVTDKVLETLVEDERNKKSPSESLKNSLSYQLFTVLPMYRDHIEPTKRNADLVVDNGYDPRMGEEKFTNRETQVKYRGTIDSRRLEEIGAEKLYSATQVDEYLVAVNKEETVRIRSELGKTTLIYQGPRDGTGERIRLECEIDAAMVKALHAQYLVKEKITKNRTQLSFKEIKVNLDSDVVSEKGGVAMSLGNFIEIKITGKNQRDSMERFISIAGLGSAKQITEAYSEL